MDRGNTFPLIFGKLMMEKTRLPCTMMEGMRLRFVHCVVKSIALSTVALSVLTHTFVEQDCLLDTTHVNPQPSPPPPPFRLKCSLSPAPRHSVPCTAHSQQAQPQPQPNPVPAQHSPAQPAQPQPSKASPSALEEQLDAAHGVPHLVPRVVVQDQVSSACLPLLSLAIQTDVGSCRDGRESGLCSCAAGFVLPALSEVTSPEVVQPPSEQELTIGTAPEELAQAVLELLQFYTMQFNPQLDCISIDGRSQEVCPCPLPLPLPLPLP